MAHTGFEDKILLHFGSVLLSLTWNSSSLETNSDAAKICCGPTDHHCQTYRMTSLAISQTYNRAWRTNEHVMWHVIFSFGQTIILEALISKITTNIMDISAPLVCRSHSTLDCGRNIGRGKVNHCTSCDKVESVGIVYYFLQRMSKSHEKLQHC